MPRSDLYPPIEPYETGLLPVDDQHLVYWEQSGNPNGIPVVFLHGGPGSGTAPIHRRFFDPARYRIILFDQRGAGRSTPLGAITNNTTSHLIADMEMLRALLNIDSWLLFGGSWGSTLALAYGQAHPDRVRGFILRGIFMGRQRELDWFLTGMGQIFPEAHRRWVTFLPEGERHDVLGSYHARLINPDPDIHVPAARSWSNYESACSTLLPTAEAVGDAKQDRRALSLARLEAHYFVNKMFVAETELSDGVAKINHLPATIVQGRYDIVCPIATADHLARLWPGATYVIVPDAGHSAMEPGIRRALLAAAERFAAGPDDSDSVL